MRLVNRKEFLELPSGTLFAECTQPWVFAALDIKGSTLSYNDYNVRGLAWVDADSSEQAIDRLEEQLKDSTLSYPSERDYGRDGCFDEDGLYMVFERDDVLSIIEDLREAYEL